MFVEASTAAGLMVWLSFLSPIICSTKGGYFQFENVPAPSAVPVGSYAVIDFHLLPQRTPHFQPLEQMVRRESQVWEIGKPSENMGCEAGARIQPCRNYCLTVWS